MSRRSSWLFFGAALSALAAVGCGSPHDGADATYLVEIRCHTPEGAPVANVRLVHPESGESGVTSAQGKLSLRLAGHEGSEATLQVSGLPDGMVLADDSPRQHIVFKSLSDATGRKRFLTHDIVLTKSKETYVLLVSTAGAPNLPVVANGITLGKLNSRGAGAFRVHGQPGEELKVVLDTIRAGAARGSSLQTFTLPAGRSILSFQSDLTLVAANTPLPSSSADAADGGSPRILVKFNQRRHHERSHGRRGKLELPVPASGPEKPQGPVQVPFRGVDLQKG